MSNPLDLHGPEFLGLYIGLTAVSFALAFAIRYLLRPPFSPLEHEPRDLTPYEIAYLGGGSELCAQAAVARLVQGGYLKVDAEARLLKRTNKVFPEQGPHALECAVYRYLQTNKGASPASVARAVEEEATQIGARSRELGLALSREASLLIRFTAAVPLLAVLILGLMKFLVGVSRERPVGILFVLCIATAYGMIVLCRRQLWQTVRGERVLYELKCRNTALECASRRAAKERLAGEDLVRALGLFGVGILAAGAMKDLHQAFIPPPSSSGGSSCGGSSCGGGCGGGGCGGCGG